MHINDQELRKLGFRPKKKNRNELEVHVALDQGNYLSISISKLNENWEFSGLEVEGKLANEIQQSEFKRYDLKEILHFLNKY